MAAPQLRCAAAAASGTLARPAAILQAKKGPFSALGSALAVERPGGLVRAREAAFPGERMRDDGAEIVVLRHPAQHRANARGVRHDCGRIAGAPSREPYGE